MRVDALAVRQAMGHRIYELRTALGWTQAELAAKAALGVATVAAIEHGDRRATVDTYIDIANALDVQLLSLLRKARIRRPTTKRGRPRKRR
jgi:transcriptional regulator with XRE-family HTH domain